MIEKVLAHQVEVTDVNAKRCAPGGDLTVYRDDAELPRIIVVPIHPGITATGMKVSLYFDIAIYTHQSRGVTDRDQA